MDPTKSPKSPHPECFFCGHCFWVHFSPLAGEDRNRGENKVENEAVNSVVFRTRLVPKKNSQHDPKMDPIFCGSQFWVSFGYSFGSVLGLFWAAFRASVGAGSKGFLGSLHGGGLKNSVGVRRGKADLEA